MLQYFKRFFPLLPHAQWLWVACACFTQVLLGKTNHCFSVLGDAHLKIAALYSWACFCLFLIWLQQNYVSQKENLLLLNVSHFLLLHAILSLVSTLHFFLQNAALLPGELPFNCIVNFNPLKLNTAFSLWQWGTGITQFCETPFNPNAIKRKKGNYQLMVHILTLCKETERATSLCKIQIGNFLNIIEVALGSWAPEVTA